MNVALPDLITLIGHWATFYGLVAGASATLVGLLFIAVSLHLDIFNNRQETEARLAAEQTLTNYSTLLVIGLLFNIPSSDPVSLGISIAGIGIGGVIRTGVLIIRHFREDWLDKTRRPVIGPKYINFLTRRIIFPALSYSLLIYTGSQFMALNTSGIGILIGVVFFILSFSLANTWNLLVNLSRFRFVRKNDPQPPPAP